MLKPVLLLSAVACLLAGCGPSPGADSATTSDDAAKTEMAAGQAGSDNAACKLFTAAEIEKFTGEPMNDGQTAGPQGSACQWIAKDDEGDAMLQIVSAEYADNPTLAEGYKSMPAFGEKAYVAKDFGGYVAGAVEGADFIKVMVEGENTGEPAALAFLQEALAKHN